VVAEIFADFLRKGCSLLYLRDAGHFLLRCHVRRAYVDPLYWDGRTFSAQTPSTAPSTGETAAAPCAPPPLLSFLGSSTFAKLVRLPTSRDSSGVDDVAESGASGEAVAAAQAREKDSEIGQCAFPKSSRKIGVVARAEAIHEVSTTGHGALASPEAASESAIL
jgi:hypothetical protein